MEFKEVTNRLWNLAIVYREKGLTHKEFREQWDAVCTNSEVEDKL